ncbi:NAD(P)-binding protein [Ramaria rubella]|nr:NAD(P)-binding protein [Ramaria rubella]
MSPSSLFLLGATGYIGGSLLKSIVATHPQLSITAIVRNPKDNDVVRAAGATNVVNGSHEELEKIRNLATQADIVVNAADADDLPLTKAILEGLKSRAQSVTFKPILIHTSGTGVVSDNAQGEFAPSGQKIWNDNSEEDIRSIPPEKPHRLIDLEIFRADERNHCSAYIIAPSTIYGTGLGPVNKISSQIPRAVQIAIKHKQAVYVGKGTNKWMNVHINDLVELYLLVLSLSLSGTDKSGPYAKFYFGSVHEHVWGDIIRQIGQILYEKQVIETREAKSVLLKMVPSLTNTANNSRSASDRGFALGWKPKSKSVEETLEEDVTATLAKLQI